MLEGGSLNKFTVVIPAYNAENYINPTINSIKIAANNANESLEIIVVNDGSTDQTFQRIHEEHPDVQIISQKNTGRFLARWNGLKHVRTEFVIFVDSRIILDHDAIKNLAQILISNPAARNVNGNLRTNQATGLSGLTWEVVTKLFWSPSLVQIGVKYNKSIFDALPKGTGLLLSNVQDFQQACLAHWPGKLAKFTSDDTKILRRLMINGNYWFEPGFSGIYIPNTGLRSFLRHTFWRGIFFGDSFKDASIRMRTVKLLVISSIPVLTILLLTQVLDLPFAALALLLAVASVSLIALKRGASAKSLASFVLFFPLFVPIYWCGVVFGEIRRKFGVSE